MNTNGHDLNKHEFTRISTDEHEPWKMGKIPRCTNLCKSIREN
jgi:hypothetical protein